MQVLLKRGLFIGGSLYAASRYGTEIPDQVDGLPVVFPDDKVDGPCILLPEDAERIGDTTKPVPEVEAPMALSEMATKTSKPKTFTEAMDKK